MFKLKNKFLHAAGDDTGSVPAPSDDEGSPPEYASIFEQMAGDILGEDTASDDVSPSSFDDASDEEDGTAAPLEEVVVPPVEPVVPPVETPVVEPTLDEKKDGEQPPAVTEPPPVSPTPISKTPEEIQAEYNGWLQTAETQLAEQHYKLDDGVVDEFNSDPGKVLPKLLAKAHIQIQNATMMAIAQMFPQIMAKYTSDNAEKTRIETTFFGMWPGLAPVKDKAVVDAVPLIQHFRNVNPSMTEEELMQQVGATLHVTYKIPVAERQPNTAVLPVSPASMPPSRAPTGAPGARPNPQGSQKPSTWTEELVHEFNTDD